MKAKTVSFLILLLFVCCLFGACEGGNNNNQLFLGSLLNLQLHGKNSAVCEREIREFLNDFENKISVNIPSSEVCAFNAAKKGETVRLSEHVFNVFEKALSIYDKTEGAFNPCIYETVKLWGFTPDTEYNIPTQSDIDNALIGANPENLTLDSENFTAVKSHDAIMVDFGGIAKGYALGVCRQIAAKHNIASGKIDIAGNIYVIGRHIEDREYNIGITDPRGQKNKNDYFCIINTEENSVSVSGDYQRFFIRDGKRYCHIINPFSGYPIDNGVISVVIVGQDAAAADAYSTAVMVMGLNDGYDFMRKNDIKGIIITENGYKVWGIELSEVYSAYQLIS